MSVDIYNKINPIGRLGNQMFTLFLGKIISQSLGFQLRNLNEHTLLDEFHLDYCNKSLQCYNTPIQYLDNCNFNLCDIINDNTPRRIVLDHYFQKKEYYIPYKSNIKKWCNITPYIVNDNDIGMHIRLGDLMDYNSRQHLLPISYYIEAIDAIKDYDIINITTDSPNHEYIKILTDNYKCNVITMNSKKTLDFLSHHKKLILSQGTFSFWAGFLSDAETIINALPKTGWNSLENKNMIDLIMEDDVYKIIRC